MKNFRKVLALILVVATLFSFVAMTSAKTAEDYSDANEIKYVEAVDVLSAVGILKGYNGAYHPGDSIDRDEMAKMIAVLRNGAVDNAALFTGANPFADVKGSWAEGYIAYCAQLGIIAGRNATTFDPDGKVTGVEVMKMLLCVLGYDAKLQGYVGANWQTNVIRDANKMSLMEGMEGFDPYEAATRDEAAQLMLNALKTNLVCGYISENIVKVTNSLYDFVSWNGILWPTGVNTPDSTYKGLELAYCNAVISNVPAYKIIKGLDVIAEEDCYERPGYQWIYKPTGANPVWFKFYALTPDAVQTAGTMEDVMATALSLAGQGVDVEFFVDGVWKTNLVNNDYVYGDKYWTDEEIENWANSGYGVTTGQALSSYNIGNGTVVEFYYDEAGFEVANSNYEVRVVIINTYIGEVTLVNEDFGFFCLDGNTSKKYELDGLAVKEDDIVLYWLCDANDNEVIDSNDAEKFVHDIKLAPVTVSTIENYWNNNVVDFFNDSFVVASGKTYNYAANCGNSIDPTKSWMPITGIFTYDPITGEPVEAIYDIYTDEFGYIMYYKPHVDELDLQYGYVIESTAAAKELYKVVDATGKIVPVCEYTADMVKFDGSMAVEEVAITENVYKAMIASSAYANGRLGALISYYVDEDGNYELNEAVDVVNKGNVGFAPAGTKLVPGEEFVAANIYVNNNTKFMVRTRNANGTYTYTQYNGIDALPATYAAENITGAKTNIQFFRFDEVNVSNKWLEYVFIDAMYTAGADHFLLLDGPIGYGNQSALLNLYHSQGFKGYDALVDGEKAVIMVDPALISTAALKLGYLYNNTLTLINSEIPYDGGYCALYVMAEKPAYDLDFKAGNFVVDVEDKTFIEVEINGVLKPVETAADFAIWSIFTNEDGDLVAEEGYMDFRQTGKNVDYGYVIYTDASKTEVAAVYVIANDANNYWGITTGSGSGSGSGSSSLPQA